MNEQKRLIKYLRELHISGLFEIPKCNEKVKDCTLDCTLDEKRVLTILKDYPQITQIQLAEEIGKSVRTVKNITVSLEEKGLIERVNGKRFGYWKVK